MRPSVLCSSIGGARRLAGGGGPPRPRHPPPRRGHRAKRRLTQRQRLDLLAELAETHAHLVDARRNAGLLPGAAPQLLDALRHVVERLTHAGQRPRPDDVEVLAQPTKHQGSLESVSTRLTRTVPSLARRASPADRLRSTIASQSRSNGARRRAGTRRIAVSFAAR